MWRYISGCVRGASHEKLGEPCQDSQVALILPDQEGHALAACISDGAGSASQSHFGSETACREIATRAERHFSQHGSFAGITRDDAVAWLAGARDAIREVANQAERQINEYACTISVALITPEHSVFFQIGDGGMVARRSESYGVVFWPQSGEYANSTNFLTQEDFDQKLDYLSEPGGFEEVALFTDGLERLALKFEGQTAHAPFFAPLFQAVRDTQDCKGLNEELSRFLKSEHVQNRSDDDKTVILAIQHSDQ